MCGGRGLAACGGSSSRYRHRAAVALASRCRARRRWRRALRDAAQTREEGKRRRRKRERERERERGGYISMSVVSITHVHKIPITAMMVVRSWWLLFLRPCFPPFPNCGLQFYHRSGHDNKRRRLFSHFCGVHNDRIPCRLLSRPWFDPFRCHK